jgi:DNA-binding PadR family transcriptional regulator
LHRDEIPPIQQASDDVLQVEEGSLYPALQRMLIKDWVTAKWGTTAGNRRARYYQLTPAGRKQLALEMTQFERVIGAIPHVSILRYNFRILNNTWSCVFASRIVGDQILS